MGVGKQVAGGGAGGGGGGGGEGVGRGGVGPGEGWKDRGIHKLKYFKSSKS